MSRKHVEVSTPAIGLRRADAAAALGVSQEIFDKYVRPNLPVARCGTVRIYPVAALVRWLEENAERPLS